MPVIARRGFETPLGVLETVAELAADVDRVRATCAVDQDFPKLTKCFGVDEIRRAVWTLEIVDDVPGIRISLGWTPGYSWHFQGRCGGQNFESVQYSSDDCTVHIGSYDEPVLVKNAIRKGNGVPKRLGGYRAKLEEVGDVGWLRFESAGIAVFLPPLRKGETARIVLTAAWFCGKYGDQRGHTSWAADAALEGDVPWEERQ